MVGEQAQIGKPTGWPASWPQWAARVASLQTVPPRADEQRMLDCAQVTLSLLVGSLLTGTGCVHASAETSPGSAVIEPCSAEAHQVTLEFQPSATAAPLLPGGARYRLVATQDEIALLVVTPDNRISGRLRIRPLDREDIVYGSTIVMDDFGGLDATIDAWSSAGGLRGEATVGDRRAAWQVRVDPDGSLAGERWSVRHGSHSIELTELRRARAIGADVAALAAELVDSGALPSATEHELIELMVLADLALDLSVRAWEGRGRASLPHVSSVGAE
jgi:hypothetical protein